MPKVLSLGVFFNLSIYTPESSWNSWGSHQFVFILYHSSQLAQIRSFSFVWFSMRTSRTHYCDSIAEHEGLHRFIKICWSGPMKSHRPRQPIEVLRRIVTMISRSPILRHVEFVRKIILECDCTLCDRIDIVILEGIQHSHAMSVNGDIVIVKFIDDRNFHRISSARLDERLGVSVVEGFVIIGDDIRWLGVH